jgi:hypothetical protein
MLHINNINIIVKVKIKTAYSILNSLLMLMLI